MSKNKVEICIIEDFNINYCSLLAVTRQLFYNFFPKNNNSIYYFIDSSEKGHVVLKFLLRRFKIHFERLDFDFIEIKDENGVLLGLKVFYIDLLKIQKDILGCSFFNKIFIKDKMTTEEKLFLKKRIIEKDIFGSEIMRALYLVNVGLWKARNSDADNILFFMKPRVWKKQINNYAKTHKVRIIWEWPFIRYCRLFSKLLIYTKRIIQLAKWSKIWSYMKNEYRSKLKYISNKDKIIINKIKTNSNKAVLAVPYFGNLNLDKHELQSDLFFWHQSKLTGKDIIVMFGLSIDPFDSIKELELKENQINAISLNSRSTVVSSIPVFRRNKYFNKHFLFNKGLKILSENIVLEKNAWLKRQSVIYEETYSYWLQLFKDYNVKVHINWFKHNASHITISSAIKQLGGISTIYQRSFDDDDLPKASLATASDVVFSYNNDVSNESEIGSVIPYYVAVGYIGDYRFKLLEGPATTIRKHLQQKGAKHIIAYFDENTSDDNRWNPGHDSTRFDYGFLLEKVLANSRLGLILKPKRSFDLRERLGPIVKLLKIAEDTGRCIILEGGTLKNSYPPAIAALASDIAIGGHIWGGTAGFESALAGTPTVILDKDGWSKSKLYELGKGKVVFNDWDSLWCACKDYIDCDIKIDGFGDWSPLLDEMDPFRDGRSAERIGTYLKWLLNGFEKGSTRAKILADAAERYTDAWGHDKITSVNC